MRTVQRNALSHHPTPNPRSLSAASIISLCEDQTVMLKGYITIPQAPHINIYLLCQKKGRSRHIGSNEQVIGKGHRGGVCISYRIGLYCYLSFM